MWLDPNADGCVYDTVDCYHNCEGCEWSYPEFGGTWTDPEDDTEDDTDEDE